MRVVLVVTILVAVCLLLSDSVPLEGSVEDELNIYKAQVRVVYRQLAKECPQVRISKRQVDDNLGHLEIQKILYDELFKKLIECKKMKSRMSEFENLGPVNNTDQETSTTTAKATPTTTKQTTLITLTQPVECQQAVNYTQSWRRNHEGSGIRPGGPDSQEGYACDFGESSSRWFRFSGAAGTHMLDSCPKRRSCGTRYSYWTDEKLPKDIGAESTINVYGVYKHNCKWFKETVKVMRCSWDTSHDLIYRQILNKNESCTSAFCGTI